LYARRCAAHLMLAACLVAGCDDDSMQLSRSLVDLTLASEDLYAIPYPNDIRIKQDGTIDLAGYDRDKPELIRLYLETVAKNQLGGFGLASAIYLRFRDDIAPEVCGPVSAADSAAPGSSIFLADIDPSSPGYGERVPLRWKYVPDEQKYIGAHSLTLLPLSGLVLAPGTTYAAVVTEAMCDPSGDPVRPDSDMELLLDDRPPTDAALRRAHDAYAPLRSFMRETGLTGVVTAAVFTTGQPTELAGLARAVLHRLPAPTADDLVLTEEARTYFVIEGTYHAPSFQTGTAPYLKSGGDFELDASGRPVVQKDEALRFALSVPRGSPPAGGWPVVLYAHGTGGSYRTFISNGVARTLAEVRDAGGAIISRLAVIGIDQVLHGPRGAGSAPEVTFFNLQNPAAAVHNVVQGGVDDFSLLRMVKGLSIGRVTRAPGAGEGVRAFDPPITFDPGRIFFMGHSQGGLTGAVFLAYEPEVRAAVLSGAGGGAALGMLNKTAPIDIRPLLATALDETPDMFHPIMNMVQQMLETADTTNYGRLLLHNRPQGVRPKHIFLSEGFVDHYTPNVTTDALAVAIGLPVSGEVIRPVPGLDMVADLPSPSVALPVAGNLTIDGDAVTAALRQYRTAGEGHYVLFDLEEATRQFSRFLATAARDGVPTIVR